MAKKAQIDAVRPALTAIDAEVTAAEKAIDAVVNNADKAAEAVESGLEKVADVVPEALDKGVHVTADVARRGVRSLRNPKTMAVIVIGVSMAAGAGLGYLGYRLMRKKLEREFEDRLESEIDSMRDFYRRKYKAGTFETPETAAEALGATTVKEAEVVADAAEALDNYQGRGVVSQPATTHVVDYDKVRVKAEEILEGVTITQNGTGVEVKEKEIVVEQRNVFVDGRPLQDAEWDAEAEEANRNPERPYVISHEEFLENAFEHPQFTLTYYAGDDILAEQDDQVVNEVEATVGQDNLERFGHGSRDPNIVYIRNERIESDYEVVRSSGKYAEEVHDLRHSDEPVRRRPHRWGDGE